MNREQLEACRRIVTYLAADEFEDWRNSGQPDRHIYRDVCVLARMCEESDIAV